MNGEREGGREGERSPPLPLPFPLPHTLPCFKPSHPHPHATPPPPPSPMLQTPRLQRKHWRKSNQFFGLTRRHAEAVVEDREVWGAFERNCKPWQPQCIPGG